MRMSSIVKAPLCDGGTPPTGGYLEQARIFSSLFPIPYICRREAGCGPDTP